jgi:UDP-N-acetylmuramate--alanine ligase
VQTDVAVVTNLDDDHPYLPFTLQSSVQAVGEFVSNAAQRVVLGPSPRRSQLRSFARCEVWEYGRDFSGRTASTHGGLTEVVLHSPGGGRYRATLRLIGPATHVNASVAFVTALALGVEPEAAAAGLSHVDRIVRRLEPVGQRDGVHIFDDFGGKHPVNVRAGIAALRRHYPAARVIAVFEPYAPYLQTWGHRYARALGGADGVVLAPPVVLHDYPHHGARTKEWWRACPVEPVVVGSQQEAITEAVRLSRRGDVIVFFAQVHTSRWMAAAAATPTLEPAG